LAVSGSTPDVDPRELFALVLRILLQLARLAVQIRLLGVPLRAHRYVLTRRHRHRTGGKPRHARGQNASARGLGRCHAEHEARGRHDAVVGAQHGCAQPVHAIGAV
jgi:hypothetical protein